ncbi:hypothetical protein NMYAN_50174 [Nitrosomonas nitrosa]|uniref:Uncharacterized protein n=1 Tax=Nitrosomonas nitrosa TaxID=52442 RepID=A0A8H8Z1Q4_9PROT|nr:hypothetical protein NMYAN_50174 [Nitrosomonas nitrosa]
MLSENRLIYYGQSSSKIHQITDQDIDRILNEADQTVAACVNKERKVRAPQSRMPVNGRPP